MSDTVSKAVEYRAKLRALDEWDAYLLKESGLPGPRGNLELAQVVADGATFNSFAGTRPTTPTKPR